MTAAAAATEAYKLYAYQEAFLLDRRRFRITNKSRQTGFSFIIGLEAVTECLSKYRYLALFVSASERQARKLLEDVKLVLDANNIEYDGTKTTIDFSNGSQIVSLPNSPGSVRGYTATHVYIDEFAHFRGETDREMLAAIQPSISRGGRLTVISTPFGRKGKFYEIWTEGRNWSRHEIPWWMCSAYAPPGIERTESAWYKEMRPSYPDAEWKQEFECSFNDSGAPLFQEWAIRKAYTNAPELQGPVANHEYADGWDLARKLDWTVGVTLDATDYYKTVDTAKPEPMILVAFSRFQRKPWTFVQQQILNRQMLYNSNALLDGTGVGDPVIETLLKAYGGRGPFEGFVVGSSGKSKTDLLQNLVLILERGLIKFNDECLDLLKELRAYTWDDRGMRTDCVMALALAVWKVTNGRRKRRVARASVA